MVRFEPPTAKDDAQVWPPHLLDALRAKAETSSDRFFLFEVATADEQIRLFAGVSAPTMEQALAHLIQDDPIWAGPSVKCHGGSGKLVRAFYWAEARPQ